MSVRHRARIARPIDLAEPAWINAIGGDDRFDHGEQVGATAAAREGTADCAIAQYADRAINTASPQ